LENEEDNEMDVQPDLASGIDTDLAIDEAMMKMDEESGHGQRRDLPDKVENFGQASNSGPSEHKQLLKQNLKEEEKEHPQEKKNQEGNPSQRQRAFGAKAPVPLAPGQKENRVKFKNQEGQQAQGSGASNPPILRGDGQGTTSRESFRPDKVSEQKIQSNLNNLRQKYTINQNELPQHGQRQAAAASQEAAASWARNKGPQNSQNFVEKRKETL